MKFSRSLVEIIENRNPEPKGTQKLKNGWPENPEKWSKIEKHGKHCKKVMKKLKKSKKHQKNSKIFRGEKLKNEKCEPERR